MGISIWRYSHYLLSLLSAIFIAIASLTGIILAFEPVENDFSSTAIAGAGDLNLYQLTQTLESKYDAVLEVKMDPYENVIISVFDMEMEGDGSFYVDPFTGEKLGDVVEEKSIYQWAKTLHRSLFLKSTGRILIGITSFLLFLIVISGTVLIIKRQNGIRNFFSKMIKENKFQYIHALLGRWTLIPIVIISLSGVYLSLMRFSLLPSTEGVEVTINEELNTESDFELFKNTSLSDVKSLVYPFSEDEEDYFTLETESTVFAINQIDGSIVEQNNQPIWGQINTWSYALHTGEGSGLWAIFLLIACINILVFMYTGTMITIQRLKSKIRNRHSATEAEYVILYGSENGGSKSHVDSLQKALWQLDKKVYIDHLNNYRSFPAMRSLVVLTSTYGDGGPPSNAHRFLKLKNIHPTDKPYSFAVVGFGSYAYPKFCQFALDVDAVLDSDPQARRIQEPYLIHNQSYESFSQWAKAWGHLHQLPIQLAAVDRVKSTPSVEFEVIEKKLFPHDDDPTFRLKLKSKSRTKFESGDLLSIYPPQDKIERLYSIGKDLENNIDISIKLHDRGVCSQYLYSLEPGMVLNAGIKKNPDFHLSTKSPAIHMICNGTGIAPFLGMIHQQNKGQKKFLYWGGRYRESQELYNVDLVAALDQQSLTSLHTVYSREGSELKYVQDVLIKQERKLAEELKNGSTVMICGSITMQQEVLRILDAATQKYLNHEISEFQRKGQIKMDCY